MPAILKKFTGHCCLIAGCWFYGRRSVDVVIDLAGRSWVPALLKKVEGRCCRVSRWEMGNRS